MRDLSRRELLRGTAAGGLGLAAASVAPAALAAASVAPAALADRRHQPRVVIVGAGLAGLACADALRRQGIRSHIYEARPDRVGGRCWSSRGWADGQVAEHGGEFIDTRHTRMQALARRFGLSLDDAYDIEGKPRLWLDGRRRHRPRFSDDTKLFTQRIVKLASDIGPYHYNHHTTASRAVDEMTALDVVDTYMPGGASSTAGRAIHCFLASFLGLDLDQLSGLAVVDNIGPSVAGADERWHVHGGNDQIAHGLARCLPHGSITHDAPLSSIERRPAGDYRLRFDGVGTPVHADLVVLCLPFTSLRRVDLDAAGLGQHRRRCIDELGMGTNAKVIFQLKQRPHHYGRWNGIEDTDRPFVETWESSAGQPGTHSLITCYFGGASGDDWLSPGPRHGPAPRHTVDRVVAALNRHGQTDLPGLRQGMLPRVRLDHWARDPWTHGSYAAYLPGQYTRYAGFVGKRDGNVLFAGEHTEPLRNQGYLEGAVRSGERAAREILHSIR